MERIVIASVVFFGGLYMMYGGNQETKDENDTLIGSFLFWISLIALVVLFIIG